METLVDTVNNAHFERMRIHLDAFFFFASKDHSSEFFRLTQGSVVANLVCAWHIKAVIMPILTAYEPKVSGKLEPKDAYFSDESLTSGLRNVQSP